MFSYLQQADMVKGKLKAFRINLINESQEYCAGSLIEGNVLLELSKDMAPVKSIVMQLSGMANVKWKVSNGQGANVYRNSEGICRLEWTIWTHEGHTVSAGLSTGRYEFPFNIQIPAGLALLTSFEALHGNIRYSLIAGIRTSEETKLKHTTTQWIKVKNTVNTNIPRLMLPLSTNVQHAVHGGWHNHGFVSLSLTLNKGGYYPGEFIGINVKVENQSTKQVNAIRASLVRTVTYYGRLQFSRSHQQKSRQVINVIQSIEGSGIPAGKTGHWTNGLLPVPITPPTTDGHHIIMLSYALDVTLVYHKAGNVNVRIPVTIGTTSFREQTQYNPTEQPPSYHHVVGPSYPQQPQRQHDFIQLAVL